jgi:Family of unknown function (DUF6516)
MRARLILREKQLLEDGAIVEIVIWRLPRPSHDRPHGFKYRLFFGKSRKSVVRYDNETGKGDHKHIGEREYPYRFRDVEQLLSDFRADIERYRR